MDAVVLEDERGSILRNPTRLTPRRDGSGVKPLQHKRSGARKGILGSGRFETATEASVIDPSHCGHGADGDAEGAIRLNSELRAVELEVLP